MSRAHDNDSGRLGSSAVPPFYLREEPDRTQSIERLELSVIDDRVRTVARDNWAWACGYVTKHLHDGPRAPEIIEEVAIEVTNRLRVDAEIARNLNAYFKKSLKRRVRALAFRDGRFEYKGSALDLEAACQIIAPDWTKALDDRLIIRSFLPWISPHVRHILNYRLLDCSWKEIAQALRLTEAQAKLRFYYGLRKAYKALLAYRASCAQKQGLDEK